MNTRVDTKAMKARIDILDLLKIVGAQVDGEELYFDQEVRVYCPFCSDATSRKPAGRANPIKGLYHCWACGFGGDIFDVARQFLSEEDEPGDLFGSYSVPFEAVIAWLEAKFPVEGGDDDPWAT